MVKFKLSHPSPESHFLKKDKYHNHHCYVYEYCILFRCSYPPIILYHHLDVCYRQFFYIDCDDSLYMMVYHVHCILEFNITMLTMCVFDNPILQHQIYEVSLIDQEIPRESIYNPDLKFVQRFAKCFFK